MEILKGRNSHLTVGDRSLIESYADMVKKEVRLGRLQLIENREPISNSKCLRCLESIRKLFGKHSVTGFVTGKAIKFRQKHPIIKPERTESSGSDAFKISPCEKARRAKQWAQISNDWCQDLRDEPARQYSLFMNDRFARSLEGSIRSSASGRDNMLAARARAKRMHSKIHPLNNLLRKQEGLADIFRVRLDDPGYAADSEARGGRKAVRRLPQ